MLLVCGVTAPAPVDVTEVVLGVVIAFRSNQNLSEAPLFVIELIIIFTMALKVYLYLGPKWLGQREGVLSI